MSPLTRTEPEQIRKDEPSEHHPRETLAGGSVINGNASDRLIQEIGEDQSSHDGTEDAGGDSTSQGDENNDREKRDRNLNFPSMHREQEAQQGCTPSTDDHAD